MAITTTAFLETLKRNVTVPNNQIRFDDDDFLAMADEQMRMLMLPLITSLRSEFFVVKTEVSLVADQAEYKIPYRSVGRTLRDIKITNSDESLVYTVPYINPEDAHRFLNAGATGDVLGFTVRGDNLVLLPTPGSGTTQVMQLYWELAPSRLIPLDEAGVVSSVNTTTGAVTMNAAITGFATGQSMDIVDGQSGCTTIGIGLVNSSVVSTVVTFAAADLPVAPNAVKAGDYVCLAGESPVLQIPDECSFVLVQAVTCKVLEAQGDFEGLQNSEKKLDQNIESLKQIITPRVESQVPTIVNNTGLIRGRLFRSWYYRYNL